MTLILIGGILGVVLGVRYKVFVLVPIMCVALAIVAFDAVAHGDGFGRIALMMFSVVTSLQFGYILGSIVVYASLRLAHTRSYASAKPKVFPRSSG
jgi:hypothetical protein